MTNDGVRNSHAVSALRRDAVILGAGEAPLDEGLDGPFRAAVLPAFEGAGERSRPLPRPVLNYLSSWVWTCFEAAPKMSLTLPAPFNAFCTAGSNTSVITGPPAATPANKILARWPT